MDYKQFKKDSLNLNFTEFMNKWENHEKLLEFQEKKDEEDFYEYVCEYYNYDEYKIEQWKIFKNTCELYVKCLNDS